MAGPVFHEQDLAQLRARGLPVEEAAEQVRLLRNPPPAIVLDRPCTVGDGIALVPPAEQESLVTRGAALAAEGRVLKFVPASGAATRMFKDLIAARQAPGGPSTTPAARELFEQLDAFAFGAEVRRRARVAGEPGTPAEERRILDALLDELGYARCPKGLIPFHRAEPPRTAFEEQLLEGTRYVRDADGRCRMHFTVSPEWRDDFELTLAELRPRVESRRRGCTLEVGFSEQHSSTDTLAVDEHGEPVRTPDGDLLFRPGGHGALLRNLQDLAADVVVIKNVDNILPDESSGEAVRWKRVLLGHLARLQEEVFDLLRRCAYEEAPEPLLDRAVALAGFRFARRPAVPLADREAKRAFVLAALDRPLRVCGVVRNAGEPGGAPFWVVEQDGTQSVQIVESSQVSPGDARQQQVFRAATHFNPVDIVAGLRRWNGEPFDLARFVDPGTVFVAKKSHEGRDLHALEKPGLWNGGMAHWNTVCVEVPAATFAPVKTVFDLLRPQHQPRATPPREEALATLEGRVLVVAEHAADRDAAQRILAGAGLEVELADGAERALGHLAGGGFDLLLIDAGLEGEVLSRAGEADAARDVPVVLACAADDDRARALGRAADSVTKPFSAPAVLARVRAQLRIRHLAGALTRAHAQLAEAQGAMAEDRRAAADVQKALLPPPSLDLAGISAATVFQPSMVIGGDALSAVPLRDGRVALYVADVSGHGVASALVTLSLAQRLSGPAGLLRARDVSPSGVLEALEREYPFERFNKFFSLFLALLDADGALRYAGAGHPAPFLLRADGSVEMLEAGGPVVGMGSGLSFDEGRAQVRPGDRLVLYTDGATGDESSAGEPLGLPALVELFRAQQRSPLREACARIAETLAERRGDVSPSDDVGLLAAELR